MSNKKIENDGETIVQERQKTKEPSMFRVVLLNDNYTTMEFVVMALETIFSKKRPEAEAIMLSIHSNGSGLAGVYTKEVAETKAASVHTLARQHEFPLRCRLEKV